MATIVFGVGYIGSRLVQELLYDGREVIGFDNLFSTDQRALAAFGQASGFRFVHGDILNLPAIARALDEAGTIDAVYLLAAQSSAHPDAADPDLTEAVNLRGPRLILDALAERGVTAPIMYASSTRLYGSPLPPVVDERTPPGRFTDLQHLSKVYAEKLLEMYAGLYGLSTRVVRLGLTYGVAPVLKTDPRFMTAPNLFADRLAHGETIEVRSADAVAVIHVADAAAALLAAELVEGENYRVLNAVGSVTTIPRLADTLAGLAEARELAVAINRRVPAGDDNARLPVINSAFDPRLFSPRRSLADGLGELLDHLLVRYLDSLVEEPRF
ncbi:MAG TPA: NAD(P)-dependent oxidoreductase [Chloroflexota bacterium]|nr:NAD(P)-dependent oxidoreductase [Chloroflexota bacterium]